MNKQDSNGVRTAQDIERKYNFAKILGLTKNIETQEKGLLKIQNTLNDMLNALMINLKDILDSQSDISLWFYNGTPTNQNAPYNLWENPSDHEGDIYYDKTNGKTYQFNNLTWEINSNPDLLEAMALTNSESDTSIDHERKVFFTEPSPPYSNGDWWIQNDGTLLICQISKSSGIFENDDFINSLNYTDSIAEKLNDTLKVLKGTVTKFSEDFVQFTDLSTGGSTTIAGENIKTGSIKSNNYTVNNSGKTIQGTLIDLLLGIIDTANFKLDQTGNIYLNNGAKVIGGDGLRTNLQFVGHVTGNKANTGEYSQLGYTTDSNFNVEKNYMTFNAQIPKNFVVESAYITLIHIPIQYVFNNTITYGYSRNLKLEKISQKESNAIIDLDTGGELCEVNANYELLNDQSGNNALTKNSSGFTAKVPSSSSMVLEKIESDNLVDSKYNFEMRSGENNRLRIITHYSGNVPEYIEYYEYPQIGVLTGACLGILNVNGYMSYMEEGE